MTENLGLPAELKLKGVRLVNFCPLCMTPLLDEGTAKLIIETIKSAVQHDLPVGIEDLYNVMKPILEPIGVSAIGVYIPTSADAAEKVDFRVVFYPVCAECFVKHFVDRPQEEVKKALALIEERLANSKAYRIKSYIEYNLYIT